LRLADKTAREKRDHENRDRKANGLKPLPNYPSVGLEADAIDRTEANRERDRALEDKVKQLEQQLRNLSRADAERKRENSGPEAARDEASASPRAAVQTQLEKARGLKTLADQHQLPEQITASHADAAAEGARGTANFRDLSAKARQADAAADQAVAGIAAAFDRIMRRLSDLDAKITNRPD